MSLNKFESWMVGKKVRLVNPRNKNNIRDVNIYKNRLGKVGRIIGMRNAPDTQDELLVTDIEGIESGAFIWRFELVNDEPLPLPG